MQWPSIPKPAPSPCAPSSRRRPSAPCLPPDPASSPGPGDSPAFLTPSSGTTPVATPSSGAGAGDGQSQRLASLQVEIRAQIAEGQNALSATAPFRAWVLASLLPNMTADTGMEGAEFEAFKPFGLAGQRRIAGALLDLTVPYQFDPETP